MKKILSVLLFAMLLITTCFYYNGSAQATKKISISHKTLSLTVGKSKKLTLNWYFKFTNLIISKKLSHKAMLQV